MTKNEIIAEFERMRQYYGTETPTGELRYKIEKAFTNKKSIPGFDRLLKNYINDIIKLNTWNQRSQRNQ